VRPGLFINSMPSVPRVGEDDVNEEVDGRGVALILANESLQVGFVHFHHHHHHHRQHVCMQYNLVSSSCAITKKKVPNLLSTWLLEDDDEMDMKNPQV
jgi:hypothetical protein